MRILMESDKPASGMGQLSKSSEGTPSESQGYSFHSDSSSVDTLVQRHENRQFLLQRLSVLRQQVRNLEQEVSDIESVVHGLPYVPAQSADRYRRDAALPHFHVAATAGARMPRVSEVVQRRSLFA